METDDVVPQTETTVQRSNPAFPLYSKVITDPRVRALSPWVRWVYVVCVTHAWHPDHDDDERCGCVRNVGVGPYTLDDLADIAAMAPEMIAEAVANLKDVGLLDEAIIDGECHFRVIGCRQPAGGDGTGAEEEPTAPSTAPPDPPHGPPTSSGWASPDDGDGPYLMQDDPRVQVLVSNGVAASVACRYAGQYTVEDIFSEVIRVHASRTVRSVAAVLTQNLKSGRILRGSPSWTGKLPPDRRHVGRGRRSSYPRLPCHVDPDEHAWVEVEGW